MPNGVPKTLKIDLSKLNDQTGKDELGEGKVIALIRVSPNGVGSFVKFGTKNSTTTNKSFRKAIENHLTKLKFPTYQAEYEAYITFDFRVSN